LARLGLACRTRHVSGAEFASVILNAANPVFRPFTLIRAEVTR